MTTIIIITQAGEATCFHEELTQTENGKEMQS